MPTRSWKNWSLFITGLLTLFLPYSGLPQPIKSALLILFGLLVTAVAGSQLWPYSATRRTVPFAHTSITRKGIRKEKEPLSSVMPSESGIMSESPHDSP